MRSRISLKMRPVKRYVIILALICLVAVCLELPALSPSQVAKADTQYTVTATTDPSGAGTITGTGTYPAGTTVTMTASQGDPWSAYSFCWWTDENGTVLQYTNSYYSFVVKKDTVLIAHYQRQCIINYTGDTVARVGQSFKLSANVKEVADDNPGNIEDARVWFWIEGSGDSGGSDSSWQETKVAIKETTPGHGTAETSIEIDDPGIYTVVCFAQDDNGHYRTDGVRTSCNELDIYINNWIGSISGYGIVFNDPSQSWASGKSFQFQAHSLFGNPFNVVGYMFISDFTTQEYPMSVKVTRWRCLITSKPDNRADVSGYCLVNGKAGYTFIMYIQDNAWFFNQKDTMDIRIYGPDQPGLTGLASPIRGDIRVIR
jgi:hypothetical protein